MATTVTRPEPRAAGGAPTHRPAATPDIKRTPSSLRAAHVTAGASGDWWVMVRRGGRVSCLMWSVSAPSNKADTNTQGHNIKNNYTTYIFQMVELQNMGLRVRAPQLANKLLIVHLFIFVHILHAAYLLQHVDSSSRRSSCRNTPTSNLQLRLSLHTGKAACCSAPKTKMHNWTEQRKGSRPIMRIDGVMDKVGHGEGQDICAQVSTWTRSVTEGY